MRGRLAGALLLVAALTQATFALSRPKDPKAYARAVESWHAPAAGSAPRDKTGRPALVLRLLNRNERCEFFPLNDAGDLTTPELERASHCLRDGAGSTFPFEPRLLSMVYQAQRAFDAGEIRVISGYRGGTPKGSSKKRARRSNHSLGRAIDFIVPGTPNDTAADFLRKRGFVGVGIYPSSGFIHLDVRSKSYFWVDRSGPGRRNRERGILGDLAKESDRGATNRGEAAPDGILNNGTEAWLRSRGVAPPELDDDDDDEAEGLTE